MCFYIHLDAKKWKLLGISSRGNENIMTRDNVGFVGQALAHLDCGNDGAPMKEPFDMLQELKPQISRTAT